MRQNARSKSKAPPVAVGPSVKEGGLNVPIEHVYSHAPFYDPGYALRQDKIPNARLKGSHVDISASDWLRPDENYDSALRWNLSLIWALNLSMAIRAQQYLRAVRRDRRIDVRLGTVRQPAGLCASRFLNPDINIALFGCVGVKIAKPRKPCGKTGENQEEPRFVRQCLKSGWLACGRMPRAM